MTKEELIINVHSEFDKSNIPNSDTLVISTSGEAQTIKTVFNNKSWSEVLNKDLIYYKSALSYLSDRAFQYYVPAYMILVLNDPYLADTISSHLINALTLPLEVDELRLMNFLVKSNNANEEMSNFLLEELKNSTKNVAFFIKRMDGFTQGQGKCINEFLIALSKYYSEYFDENETIIASERYWFKFSLNARD